MTDRPPSPSPPSSSRDRHRHHRHLDDDDNDRRPRDRDSGGGDRDKGRDRDERIEDENRAQRHHRDERGEGGDEKERARRKSRRRSDEDESSDGSSDEDRHRHKRRRDSREREEGRKEHKKHKRHKKERKSSRKKERELDQRIERTKQLIDQVNASPSSLPSILTSSDYFLRSAEFRLWLHSTHNLHLDSIPASRAHSLFSDFVQLWNDHQLEPHYYKGVNASALSTAVLTSHRWGFVDKLNDDERMRIASIRDTIDTATHHRLVEEEEEVSKRKGVGVVRGVEAGRSAESGVSEVERRRERRREKERVELIADEVAPRETGREARLERKKERGEYSRRERGGDEGLDMDEKVLMGSGGDGEFQRLKDRERQRVERREEEAKVKCSEYDAREKESMKRMLESIGMADKYPIK